MTEELIIDYQEEKEYQEPEPVTAVADWLSRPIIPALNIDVEKAIYILFILFGILTRFWSLGDRVMSHDESLHTQFSYQFFIGDGYQHTPLMHGPFLFHITALFYWLLGDGDFSARVPVAILGIVLIVMPYFLRNWLGRVGAIFTAFLFLISPYVTYYSRYIRHDTYVIVWALIIFIAMWYYMTERKERYLWWFGAGMALMFATKEVAFIYVAIFGGMMVLRLLGKIGTATWIKEVLPDLRTPILIILAGLLLFGGAFGWQHLGLNDEVTAVDTTTDATEGFAADPTQPTADTATTDTSGLETTLRWIQVLGIGVLSLGLFLAAKNMRPFIDEIPEFDFVVLFTTLVLPMASPFLVTLVGWNPRDYTVNTCLLSGQETMSAMQIAMARATSSECLTSYLQSGMLKSGVFLIVTLIISVLVGLWWNKKRWTITAVIFYSIFTILYTSMFTNMSGWTSGMIGSLGYWLEQQEVQRGSQPWFYYFVVFPLYEFLAILFSLAGVWFWSKKNRIAKVAGYWLSVILLAMLGYSLSYWYFNIVRTLPFDAEPNRMPSILLAVLIAGLGLIFWVVVQRHRARNAYEVDSLFDLFKVDMLNDFFIFLLIWNLLTWLAYSYAGEKMPWLSYHFVIPTALMAGWYLNERLAGLDVKAVFSKYALAFWGLTAVAISTIFFALTPWLIGKIRFGDQTANNLTGLGRFLGSLLVAMAILYLWQKVRSKVSEGVRRPLIALAIFALLSLLTIRANYMANFPNADYTNEFMVYAHGAPATKNVVLDQVKELSMRLNGDKSINVAYDNDVSWPFTWYLRDYPNRVYYGETPSNTLNDSPIILAGNVNWNKVEPYLGTNYQQTTHTFLWWPMEDYRKISWSAILGDPNVPAEQRRGLSNPDVRESLWNIFFYRDYTKYGETFGGSYTAGEWPLRHDLRLYIRKDVLANLWDYGIGAVGVEGLTDPYEQGEYLLTPSMVINEIGLPGIAEGELNAPRNLAIAPDGRIFVADSSNHRIQVFNPDGTYVTSWGSFGMEPGQFNEPWGMAVDDTHVYVADTWNHRVQKFTTDGEYVASFGISGTINDNLENSLGLFFGPRDITLLPDNQLLVTDTGNHRLQLLDRNGNFITQVGSFGNQLGQFNEPVGLGEAPDGSFFVADTWNGRIQHFSPSLFAVDEWRVEAWGGQSINNKPYVAVDSFGRVYATDPEGFRILIFSPTGEYLGRFGQFSTGIDGFGLPNGIAIDAQDNIYIADAINHRVLKFDAIFGPPLTLDDEDEMGQDDGSTAVDEDNSADESPADEIIPSPTPDGDSGIPSDDPTPAE